MAKDTKVKELDVVEAVTPQPKFGSDYIAKLTGEQEETFPEASTIEVSYSYTDAFALPAWCDQQNYAFAWVDVRDDIQRHHSMEVEHFRIVTRMSPCILRNKTYEKDFRNHGAVERQSMILMYRPQDIEQRMRTRPVLAHKETVETLESPKQGDQWDITSVRGKDADSKIDVVAYEEAGEEGIKNV